MIINVLSIIMTRFKLPSTPYPPTVRFTIGPVGQGSRGVALGEQGKEHLERFCELLNSTEQPELKEQLRQLVARWQASGPNLMKMMLSRVGTNIWQPETYELVQSLFTAYWVPTKHGRAILHVVPNDTQLERLFGGERIYRDAWIEFGLFVLNPSCEELAGPCARCRKYYVKKRKSQKVYCSRRCGNTATALVRTAEKLKAEHKQKMIRAKALIRKWNTLKSRSGLVWKVWLREHEPNITDKFVTRWVNMGELKEPKAGSKP